MKSLKKYLAIGIVMLVLCAGSAVGGRQTASPTQPAVSVSQDRFEGTGAFQLGCSMWDEPYVIADLDAAEFPRRFMVLTFAPDPTDELTLTAMIKGPRGIVSVSGTQCGNSINWAAFPRILP